MLHIKKYNKMHTFSYRSVCKYFRMIHYIDQRQSEEEPYETMEGESELLPNETVPDGAQPRQPLEPAPTVMTTTLRGNQSSISVIGDRV